MKNEVKLFEEKKVRTQWDEEAGNAEDGKLRFTYVADTEPLLRLNQSIRLQKQSRS